MIPEDLVPGILKVYALVHHRGLSINKACDQPGAASRSTFYRYQSLCPDDMAQLELEAMDGLTGTVGEILTTFDEEQVLESIDEQRQAIGHMPEIIEYMALLAKGQAAYIEYEYKDELRVKVVVPPARDSIQAAHFVRDVARDGIVSTGAVLRSLPASTGRGSVEARQPQLPVLGVGPNFSKIEAHTADGRVFKASVEAGWEEGEDPEEPSPPVTSDDDD